MIYLVPEKRAAIVDMDGCGIATGYDPKIGSLIAFMDIPPGSEFKHGDLVGNGEGKVNIIFPDVKSIDQTIQVLNEVRTAHLDHEHNRDVASKILA